MGKMNKKSYRVISFIVALIFLMGTVTVPVDAATGISKAIKNAYVETVQLRCNHEDISEICGDNVDSEDVFSEYYEALDAAGEDSDNAWYSVNYLIPKYKSKQKTTARLGTPVDFTEYVVMGVIDDNGKREAKIYECKGTLWLKKVSGEYMITKAKRSVNLLNDYTNEIDDQEMIDMVTELRTEFYNGNTDSGESGTGTGTKNEELDVIVKNCPTTSSTEKVTITGSVSSDGSDYAKVYINGDLVKVDGYYGAWSKEVTLKEGQNTFEIKAVNKLGKVKTITKSISFQIDAPTLIIKSCPETSAVEEVTISGNTTDKNDKNPKVTINGDLLALDNYYGNWSKTVKLKEGDNNFEIKAINSMGKSTTVKKVIRFNLDAPTLIIKECPETTTMNKVTISGSVSDRNDKDPKVYINGNLIDKSYGSWSQTLTLKEGENIFEIKAVNAAGKSTIIKKVVNFGVGAPSLIIKECPASSNLNSVTISGSASDVNDNSPKVYINGDLIDTSYYGTWSKTVTLKEGENNFEIKAVNAAGKSTIIKKTINFGVGAPTLVIKECPESSTLNSVTITGNVSDNNDSKPKVYINGDLLDTSYYGSWSKTVTLKEGGNTFVIKAVNKLGKEMVITKTINFGVEAPSLVIKECPERSAATKVTISGNVSDNNDSKPKVYINGDLLDTAYYGAWSKTVTLREGENTFVIKATNNLGKETIVNKTIFFGVEAPSLIIKECPESSTAKKIVISGNVTDSNDSYPKVYINGDLLSTNYGGSWSKTIDLVEGPNSFEIKATNNLGKTTTITKVVTFAINAPNIVISDCPATSTENRVTITGSVTDDNDSSPKTYFNGDLLSLNWGGSWSKTITLVEGVNSIEIKATNKFGKETKIAKTISYGVEPPILQITACPENSEVDKITVTGTVFDKGDSSPSVSVNGEKINVSGGAWSKEITLTSGANTITIKAMNANGKSTTITKQVNYTPKQP